MESHKRQIMREELNLNYIEKKKRQIIISYIINQRFKNSKDNNYHELEQT